MTDASARLQALAGELNEGSNGHRPPVAPSSWRDHLAVIDLETVEVERVSWLWPARIPFGKVTVLDGDPGLGKSTVTLDLAARISTGSPLPTGERLDGPGVVVMLSAEDGAADTIKPRLLAAGGDERRVKIVDHVIGEDGMSRPLEIPGDLPVLEAMITEHGAKLLVVDPFMAFLAASVKANQDQDVRRAMHPLKELAERTGAAVLVVRHLNKGDGTNALYRGGGSIGIVGAARAGLIIGRSKDDPDLRVMAVSKNNLAPEAGSVGYRLVSDALYDVALVKWEGLVDVSASDLVARDDPDTPERQEATEFLLDELGKGPAKWAVVLDRAKEQEISKTTLERVRTGLKARGRVGKRQVGAPGQPGMFVEWFLSDGRGE